MTNYILSWDTIKSLGKLGIFELDRQEPQMLFKGTFTNCCSKERLSFLIKHSFGYMFKMSPLPSQD